MNFDQVEAVVAEALQETYTANQFRELNDLQLAFVGGGIAIVDLG
jgi:hypothetical protein